MIEPFQHPKALFKRATAHLDEFGYKLSSFHKGNTLDHRFEREGEWEVLVIRFTKALDPQFFCIVFDIVNCLRSVLDYAVFDATCVLKNDPNPPQTKFPFADTADYLKSEFKRGGRDVPEEMQKALLKLEPFKGGKGDALWALNKIRNTKIHRTLTRLAMLADSGLGGTGRVGHFVFIHEVSDDGKEIRLAKGKDISPGIHVRVQPTIGFTHDAVSVSDALQFLRDTSKSVGEILGAIEAETRRLTGT